MNFIDIYTRLKMRINEEIIVSYYSSYGKRTKKEYTLLNIIGFEYILLEDDKEIVNIPFFGVKSMIESINIKESNKQIYYNPYANKEIFDGLYVKTGLIENIKQKMLNNLEFDFEKRDDFIRKYNEKNTKINYDDLFLSEKQKKEFNYFFEFLIKELKQYCKRNGLDSKLKFINTGTTSIVYEIGDKIIKIGKPRRNKIIPYCEFLLQPIINRDFEFDGYPIHIEVTQKVNTFQNIKDIKDFSQMESIINEFQENLRNIGLETTDLHSGNIGILICDNRIHYDSIEFDTGNVFATSIMYNNNKRSFQKGELVLLDLDSLRIVDTVKYSNYLKSIGYQGYQEHFDDNIEQKKIQKCLNKIMNSTSSY